MNKPWIPAIFPQRHAACTLLTMLRNHNNVQNICNITYLISYLWFDFYSLCLGKQHGPRFPYPHHRYIRSWEIIWFKYFCWNGCTCILLLGFGWSGSKTKWEWGQLQRSCFHFATIDISHSVLWWWWGYSICFLSTRLSDALASLALMVVTGSLTHWLIETGDWQFRMYSIRWEYLSGLSGQSDQSGLFGHPDRCGHFA